MKGTEDEGATVASNDVVGNKVIVGAVLVGALVNGGATFLGAEAIGASVNGAVGAGLGRVGSVVVVVDSLIVGVVVSVEDGTKVV